jgi:hypothetical protein
VQVHDDDLGGELSHEPNSRIAGAGLARDLDATLLEQVAETGPEQVMIVHEQNVNTCGGFLAWRGDLGQTPPFFSAAASKVYRTSAA